MIQLFKAFALHGKMHLLLNILGRILVFIPCETKFWLFNGQIWQWSWFSKWQMMGCGWSLIIISWCKFGFQIFSLTTKFDKTRVWILFLGLKWYLLLYKILQQWIIKYNKQWQSYYQTTSLRHSNRLLHQLENIRPLCIDPLYINQIQIKSLICETIDITSGSVPWNTTLFVCSHKHQQVQYQNINQNLLHMPLSKPMCCM